MTAHPVPPTITVSDMSSAVAELRRHERAGSAALVVSVAGSWADEPAPDDQAELVAQMLRCSAVLVLAVRGVELAGATLGMALAADLVVVEPATVVLSAPVPVGAGWLVRHRAPGLASVLAFAEGGIPVDVVASAGLQLEVAVDPLAVATTVAQRSIDQPVVAQWKQHLGRASSLPVGAALRYEAECAELARAHTNVASSISTSDPGGP